MVRDRQPQAQTARGAKVPARRGCRKAWTAGAVARFRASERSTVTKLDRYGDLWSREQILKTFQKVTFVHGANREVPNHGNSRQS
jgi:hypothetical protein